MKPFKTILILILCSVVFSCAAGAAELELGDSGWSIVADPSAISQIGSLQRPMIYSITETSISIEIDKTFDVMGTMEIGFKRTSNTNVNTIIIEDERVTNDTGIVWYDYHMYLDWNNDIALVGFNDNYTPDGGQLELVSYSNPDGYNDNPILLNFVDNDGSGVLSDPDELDEFSPGLVSGQIVIDVNPRLLVGDSFILGQYPTVPEPATCALLIAGILPAILKKKRKHLVVLIIIAAMTMQASAGEFILGDSGWTAYTSPDDDVIVNYIDEDFQDVFISIDKTFNNPVGELGQFSPIVIEFKKTGEQFATPLINIVQENVFNNTGLEWTDYHMFLAVDWFSPEAGFIEKEATDGDVLEDVQFDDKNGLYGRLPLELNFYNSIGGGVVNGGLFTPGNITIEVNEFDMSIGDSFLLKQYPTIPEPATILLLGAGLLPAILKRKKQKLVVNSIRG